MFLHTVTIHIDYSRKTMVSSRTGCHCSKNACIRVTHYPWVGI